jgi:hypothetical protein
MIAAGGAIGSGEIIDAVGEIGVGWRSPRASSV